MTKILRLQSENIKRVIAIDISPQDSTVIISGKNEQGKSSLLDCIPWAFEGASVIDDVPIHEGAEEGSIRVELDDGMIVERTFTAKGTKLKVTNQDGAKFSSPQDMLDKFLGQISFDPLKFLKLRADDQFDALSKLVKLDFDLRDYERDQKTDYDKRTEVNRRVASAKSRVELFGSKRLKAGEEIPVRVNVADIVSLRDKYIGMFAQLQEHQRNAADVYARGVQQKQKIDNAERELAIMHTDLENLLVEGDTLKNTVASYVKTLPSDEETAKVNADLDNVVETNERVTEIEANEIAYDESFRELKESETDSKKLTEKMDDREQKKNDAIAALKMPIEGLELREGKVFYKGFPLSQASGAAQLKVSMSIAMAMNPKLRVIRVKDASLLDSDNMEIVKSMAKENDFQIWLETVQSSDPMAVIIEDGRVKNAKKGIDS